MKQALNLRAKRGQVNAVWSRFLQLVNGVQLLGDEGLRYIGSEESGWFRNLVIGKGSVTNLPLRVIHDQIHKTAQVVPRALVVTLRVQAVEVQLQLYRSSKLMNPTRSQNGFSLLRMLFCDPFVDKGTTEMPR